MTISPDTLRRINRIELRTRKLVQNSFAGAYHSSFKGHGIMFDSVRPYQPGDDIRTIDWNVTARTGEAYVKRFVEERELTVMLVLDSSASCVFGTRQRQKRDLAAELGAVLALSATENNDRVGLLTFSDRIETYIPPQKGRNHILQIIRELLKASPEKNRTNLGLGFSAINRAIHRRAIIFFMSDFLVHPDEYIRDLTITAKHHDVIAITLNDPSESSLPNIGLVAFQDAETGSTEYVDTSARQWQSGFQSQARRFQQYRNDILSRSGADRISLSVEDDYINAIRAFFHRRIKQAQR